MLKYGNIVFHTTQNLSFVLSRLLNYCFGTFRMVQAKFTMSFSQDELELFIFDNSAKLLIPVWFFRIISWSCYDRWVPFSFNYILAFICRNILFGSLNPEARIQTSYKKLFRWSLKSVVRKKPIAPRDWNLNVFDLKQAAAIGMLFGRFQSPMHSWSWEFLKLIGLYENVMKHNCTKCQFLCLFLVRFHHRVTQDCKLPPMRSTVVGIAIIWA